CHRVTVSPCHRVTSTLPPQAPFGYGKRFRAPLRKVTRMSFGGDEEIGFATARGRDWPSVRQFNVFLENRLGALLDLVRRFETTDIRIVSLTVVDSADCAIIRMVLSDPERALEIFNLAKLPITESDL